MQHLRNSVAGLTILAMALCLYFIVHAGSVLNEAAGPSWLAAGPDGKLYVASHGSVHVFSREGRRESMLDLEALGLSRTPSDMAARSDGKLMIADSTPRIAVCDLAARKCDTRELALKAWTSEFFHPGNAIKFAIDEKRDRIYVSDNAGHGLVITDGSGRQIARTPAGSRIVFFPNQILADVPGEVTLADTDHHRVVTFDVSQDRIGKMLREFSTDAPGIARLGRRWPFGIVRDGEGGMWVAVARDGMKDADLIRYSAEGRARMRLDLGERSDPWAIVAWNGRIVMGDARNYRLVTFKPDGTDVRDFDDPQFAPELARLRGNALDWRYYRFAAIVGMVIFPLLAIFALWRLGTPLVAPARAPIARPAGIAPPPATKEVRWVGADPAFIARQRRLVLVILVLMIVCGVLLVVLEMLAPSRSRHLIATVLPLAVFGIVLNLALYRIIAKQLARIRLGASSAGFHCEAPPRPAGKMETRGPIAWSDVYFDGRRLLSGRTLIMAKSPFGYELFPREPFEREILARIPAANFVSAPSLGFRAIGESTPVTKFAYALLGVVTLGAFVLAIAMFASRA